MTKSQQPEGTKGLRFWELIFWIVLPGVLTAVFLAISPVLGIIAALALAAAALAGFLGKLAKVNIRAMRSIGLAIAALFVGMANMTELTTRNQLAHLEQTSTEEYLAKLKEVRPDEIWLAELARLEPEAHRSELERREQETMRIAAAKAEEQAIKAAAREARKTELREQMEAERSAKIAQERDAYIDGLKANVAELEAIAPLKMSNRDDLVWALDYFDGFGEFVHRGASFELSAEDEALRLKMKSLLAGIQKREFPRMRDAYGPIQRSANWRILYTRDTALRTIGAGYKRIEFSGSQYYVKAYRLEDYEAIAPELARMRFSQAEFRVSRGGEGTVWKLVMAPDDAEVGYWHSASNFFIRAD